VVTAQNAYDIAKLNLVQLLNLEESESKDFQVSVPAMDTIPVGLASDISPANIFQDAVALRPEMRAADTRIKSNHLALAIARGNYYPQLSLFGAYGTGYSQLQRQVTGYQTPQLVQIGATQSGETVYTAVSNPITELTPFGTQLTNNVNKTFGFSLSVPIFNGLQVRTSVAKAKINYEISKLTYDQTALTLRKNIEQAFYDARAAYKKYVASKKSEESASLAFKFATDRFDAGLLNTVDYATQKNSLTLAQSNLLQAKYDFIFKSKLLDFYRGKPLY
jgi:outer membrane protein